MTHSARFRTAFSFRAALFCAPAIFPLAAEASCGLQSCPRPAHHEDPSALEADLRSRWVAFDAEDGVTGSYVTFAPRILWRPLRHWALAAEVPVTRLQAEGDTHTGLSNPLVTGLYARRLSYAWSGEAGLQIELPLGDADHGLADDHVMVLPWLGLHRDFGAAWQVSALLGFSRAIESGHEAVADSGVLAKAGLAKSGKSGKAAHDGVDHEAGGTPVRVGPHGDREIQWRAAVSRLAKWGGSATVAEAFVFGQADVTEGTGAAAHYVRAGLSYDYALTSALTLQATTDVPVTSRRRSEASAGLSLRAGW